MKLAVKKEGENTGKLAVKREGETTVTLAVKGKVKLQ